MKRLSGALLLTFLTAASFAQNILHSPTSGAGNASTAVYLNQRESGARQDLEQYFDPALKPFYHGVASGDPLSDRVIIWTRITPDSAMTIEGNWLVSSDTTMNDTVASGSFTTNASKDYTVKIDADGLQSNTTYYYMFTALEAHSLIGRMKTAPTGAQADHLKFAVVSCQNYEAGYFNAFSRIADRNDIDAVVHLGDYIYEYPVGVYGDSLLQATGDRNHDTVETVELDQYRTRYSLYRLDADLRRAHQQHAFVNIWDDHESANDAWSGGAENHTDSTEGDWSARLNVAKQAFFEWIPIRETSSSIYRTLNYGNLVDLIMLDTRIEGREEQINDVLDPALYSPARTMLGSTQRSWFLDALDNSSAKWKIVGNQVIFSEFHVGWAAVAPQTPTDVESIFLDIWDGYPAERLAIIEYLEDNSIDNVVFLTGDFHSTFAFDVADSVTNPAAFYAPTSNYNPATGDGSVAVEFAVPSIASANFDENVGEATAAAIEFQINNPLPAPLPPQNIPNPHMKFVDLDQHGYFILDVKDDSTQADWFFVDRIDQVSGNESFAEGWYSMDGDNHLSQAGGASAAKSTQEDPAPDTPPTYVPDTATGIAAQPKAASFAVMGVYPNPVRHTFTVQYALNSSEEVSIELLDAVGRPVKPLMNTAHAAGIYNFTYNPGQLPAGIYMLRLRAGAEQSIQRIIIAE